MNDFSLNKIGERLGTYRKHKGYSVAQLAEIIGISHGFLSDVINGKSKLSTNNINKVFENTDIDPGWLLTGRGDPVDFSKSKTVANEPASSYESPNSLAPTGSDIAENDTGEFFKQYAIAGAGDPYEAKLLGSQQWIKLPGDLVKPHIIPFLVKGDSMDPIITDGSFVLVNTKVKEPKNGKIFCINLPYEGCVVKWLHIEANKLVFSSENKKYRDFSMTFAEYESYDNGLIVGMVKLGLIYY